MTKSYPGKHCIVVGAVRKAASRSVLKTDVLRRQTCCNVFVHGRTVAGLVTNGESLEL